MKIDHVHFYTRNAARTRDWFIDNIGFKAIGNCISQHTHTELIALNSAFFLISSPLNTSSPVAKYLNHHPPGVADIAFRVNNLREIIKRSRFLGVNILQQIKLWRSKHNCFKFAQIAGWQDLQHTLIEDRGNFSCCIPLSIKPSKVEPTRSSYSSHITNIDHIVLNVTQGKLMSATKLYQDLFDLEIQQSFDIQTSQSGLTSKALIDKTGAVQFNINQPTTANSQIQEFVDFNGGSGIQHLALRSQNLIADIAQMEQGELKFLDIPPTYYHGLQALSGLNSDERQAIAQHNILVDSNRAFKDTGQGASHKAYLENDHASATSLLMQIFTKPIFEQPTFFLEFIERRLEAQGFGEGNFKALFEAVERLSNINQSRDKNKTTSG